MPAYNHTRENFWDLVEDHLTLNHEGDFHCYHSPCAAECIGRSSLAVQRHFTIEHDFDLGRELAAYFPPKRHPAKGHLAAEGIQA